MQITALTSKQKYEACKLQTYTSIDRLYKYFCFWLIMAILCIAIVITNLIIYKGLGRDTILVLMLMNAVTGK